MALAVSVGKGAAHAHVEAASREAIAAGRPLADVLAEDTLVATVFDRDAIARLLSPERYLGSARTFVERVLAAHDKAEGA